MASHKTTFAVGAFVIIGLAIAITAIVWLGMSKYFDKGQNFVAYFDESVQGLAKDSPVKYRGVAIGRVRLINVAPDDTLIEVVLSLDTELKPETDMVAQLKTVGITGIMFIELDRKNENEPDRSPKISFKPKYPVIHTKPSGVKLFFESMDVLLDQLKSINGKEIAEKLTSILDSINQAFKDAQIARLSSDVHDSFVRVEKILEPQRWEKTIGSIEKAALSFSTLSNSATKTVSNIDKNLNTLTASANNTITGLDQTLVTSGRELNSAVADFRHTLNNIDKFLENGTDVLNTSGVKLSSLQRHLTVTLQNLEKASESLNKLIELLSEQPSQLIFGEPVPIKPSDLNEK